MAFLAAVLFFVMLIPAQLSLQMASSNTLAVLWNFAWYMAMGALASFVVGTPLGYWVTIYFGVRYISRLIRNPAQPRSQFNIKTFQFGANPFEARSSSGNEAFSSEAFSSDTQYRSSQSMHSHAGASKRTKIANEDVVIEAEFRREAPDETT